MHLMQMCISHADDSRQDASYADASEVDASHQDASYAGGSDVDASHKDASYADEVSCRCI